MKIRVAATPPCERMKSRACVARVDTGELQRRVGLDRRREVGRPLEPDRPGAVVALPREQLVGDLAVELGVAEVEDVVPEQVLRDHRRVRLELADPVAVGVLELEQARRGRVDRRVEPRLDPLGSDGHAATSCRARLERTRCGEAAADRALHRRRPAGGRPRARARDVRLRGLRSGPVRLAPGTHGDRGLRLAADARPEQLRRAEPVGQRAGDQLDQLAAAQLRARVRRSRRRSGTGRAPGSCPVSAPRSKTQCAGLPSSAASGSRSSGRSNQQVDADDRRVLELRLRLAEQARALGRRDATTTTRRRRARPAPRRARRTDSRARGLERPPRGLAVHLAERPRRQHEVGVALAGEQRRPHGEPPGAALASSARRFRAGRMKTSQKRSIARSDWPRARSASAKVSPRAPRPSARARCRSRSRSRATRAGSAAVRAATA